MIAKLTNWWRERQEKRTQRELIEKQHELEQQFQIEEVRGVLVVTCNGITILPFKKETTLNDVQKSLESFRVTAWNYEQLPL